MSIIKKKDRGISFIKFRGSYSYLKDDIFILFIYYRMLSH